MAGEWPPPFDPALMGAPLPYPAPAPMPDVWPPPEWAAAMAPPVEPPPPVDPIAQANAALLQQPPAPPVEEAPWPPPEWGPPPAPEPQAAPPQAAAPLQQQPQGREGQIRQTGGIVEDSLLREGEYRGEQADVRAKGMAKQAKTAALYDLQAEKRAMDRKVDLDQRWKSLEAERQEIANTKIDPTAFYSDMSTGQRIGWAVSAGIAGMLAVRQGHGRNSVLDAMGRMVDQDIEAQRANLANRRQGLGDGMSLYQQLVEKYGDEEKAAGMAKAAAWDRIGAEFEAQAAQYENPIAKENALRGAAGARQQADALTYQNAVTEEQRAFENKMQQRQVGIQAYNAKTGRMNVEMDADAAAKKAALEWAKLTKEQQQSAILDPAGRPIIGPDGRPLIAPDPKVALEERQRLAAGWAYYQELKRYEKATEELGREFGGFAGVIGSTEGRSRAETMHKSLMMKYKSAEHLGALDKGAIDVFNAVVAPPSTWTNSRNPAASANEAARVYKDTANNEMRQVYGYSGNFVDDYESQEASFKKDDTSAKGNQQGMKREMPWFVDEQGRLNQEGRGRTATDAEIEAHARRNKPQATKQGIGPY